MRTGLKKYYVRTFQKAGYFTPEYVEEDEEWMYDERWVDFWIEVVEYTRAGMNEGDALEEAYADVFLGRE